VAIGELGFFEGFGRNGDVLLLSARVGKTKVHEFDFVVLDHFGNVGAAGHPVFSWLCLIEVDGNAGSAETMPVSRA
jgi:hypothetical protein